MSENRIEIEPNEYTDHFIANTALIVSMRPDGEKNVMALDWKKMEEIDGYPVIRAQVAYSRYTYELLTKGINEFTINIPSNKIHNAISIAGSYSGRDTDKFERAGLETIPGEKIQVPTLKDCILNYECRIIDTSKSNLSSHHYFYGKILKAFVSKELI
ncbi:MAG: flavin reductase family protein [Promethearchaeota archaeon]|nr:MAG: flavin reductase family protein [Candidatus Lokiarchaeota archaeon]